MLKGYCRVRMFLGKKAFGFLACLILFQAAFVRADIQGSVTGLVNQLQQSFISKDVFNDKYLLTAIVFFSICVGYSWYIKNRGSKETASPLGAGEKTSISEQEKPVSEEENEHVLKAVTEIEEILKLKQIQATSSSGALGQDLYIRTEAIYRVLNATQNPDSCSVRLEEAQQTRMKQLLQNPMIKIGLIRNQEEQLKKELATAENIWQLDSYGDIARKKLGLSELTQKCYRIGLDPDNKEKKEAYEKLDSTGKNEVALETFSRGLYSDTSRLGYWQENSTLFKESLKQILAAQKK